MAKAHLTGLAQVPIRLHKKGSGPALFLLHCLGVDHTLWELAAAGLEDHFTLISYDFPGHGEAPVPERPYAIADLSHQLAGAFEREGLTRAHVAGISLGGLVAQHFAAPIRSSSTAWCSSTRPRATLKKPATCGLNAPGQHARQASPH